MKELWNKRYKADEYVYGKSPNIFFKEIIDKLDSNNRILLPGDGEGRNAVYAAKMGHSVVAFDISTEGKQKAMKLAKENDVLIEYLVGELSNHNLEDESFDIAALMFVHTLPELRKDLHHSIGKLIRPNGLVVVEGFSVNNLKYKEKYPNIGGPGKKEMLFSKEIIAGDFDEFDVLKLDEQEVELNEGKLHKGLGKVIRFIGKKL